MHGSWVAHRIVGMLIALVLIGDAAALAVISADGGGQGAAPPTSLAATTSTTLAPRVIFRDDFSSDRVFRAGDDDDGSVVTIDGMYRQRFRRDLDIYTHVPEQAPEHTEVEQTQNLRISVDVQNVSGEPDNWFGLYCRSMGLGSDLYRARVSPDGSWSLDRTTIGSPYVSRTLARGRSPDIAAVQPAAFVFRLRLDCVGGATTTLLLSINDREVGIATDPAGLGPGQAGLAASSTTGELAFDNLVVAALA
ncbi:MAG: hypothetical protein ACRD12_05790 [Acidimicrobiales bacterium]